MHPEVSRVVSHYQYEGPCPTPRRVQPADRPAAPSCQPAAPSVRPRRGRSRPPVDSGRARAGEHQLASPGHSEVLEKLFADPEVRKAGGLFITPFKAQARDIAAYFAEERSRLVVGNGP